MIWSATGNQWLDKWVNQAMNFHAELHSGACHYSPLDNKDKEDLEKIMAKLNRINQRVAKRVQKQLKKKKK